MKINNCLNLILIPIIIILFNLCLNKKNKIENFTDLSLKEKIKKQIDKDYQVNFGKFRELSKIISDLENGKEMNLDLNVLGEINLIPKYTIIAYFKESPPTGWAICNGETVKAADGKDFTTPDLREKFIIGTNDYDNIGGNIGNNEEMITEAHMQSHNHGGKSGFSRDLSHHHKHTDVYHIEKINGDDDGLYGLKDKDVKKWKNKTAYHLDLNDTDLFYPHDKNRPNNNFFWTDKLVNNHVHHHKFDNPNYKHYGKISQKGINIIPPNYTLIFIIKI